MNEKDCIVISLLLIASSLGAKSPKSIHGHDRIIEGVRAQIKEYPFMASILYKGKYKCGGSIITDKTILTAAHCWCTFEHLYLNKDDITVSVGNEFWKKGKKFKAYKLIVHENYESISIINDVALVILKHTLSKSPDIAAVKLSQGPLNEDGKIVNAAALGWGFTSKNGVMVKGASEQLMRVNLYSVTPKKCRRHYDDIGPKKVCFGSNNRRGTCNGDSGGPLVIRMKKSFEQIGIVSYGGPNCNNTVPEVYSRISTFYEWIAANAYTTESSKLVSRFAVNNFKP